MRIRVLGGGVAGLACAVALRHNGFDDVVVLDRDSPLQARVNTGHGLILMQNGVAALRALGVDGMLSRYRPLDLMLTEDHRGLVTRSTRMDGVYCVSRAGIVDALRAVLPGESVEYGRRCVGIELRTPLRVGQPRTVRGHVRSVRFEQGRPLTDEDAELFVGADGAGSVMYSAFNPGAGRLHSSVSEIVTSTRLPDLAAQLGSTFLKTVFAGRGLAFGLLSPTADRVIGYLQFDRGRYGAPPGTTGADLAAFVASLVGDAPEPMATYLRRADYSTAHLWRPLDAGVAPELCGDNAVLIGDAAHPLLPFTSQGAASALEDGVMLADALAGGDLGLLPRTLAGFADDRRADLTDFLDGGHRILAQFVGASTGFVTPYVEGSASHLGDHLGLPPTTLRSLCEAFDTDDDGRLSQVEFGQLLDLVLAETGYGPAARQALFGWLDTDGDRFVGVDELLAAIGAGGEAPALLSQVRKVLTPRRVRRYALAHRVGAAFRALDADEDGLIDFGEFATAIALFGIVREQASLRMLFRQADADRDDLIRPLELSRAVTAGFSQPVQRTSTADDPLFADASVDVPALRRRAYNHRWAEHAADVVPLSAADSDFPVSEGIVAAVQRYVATGYLPYGPPEGLPDFRGIAAEELRVRRRLACTPDTVFPTDSAASAVFLVARLALTEPGDEAIVPDPVDFLLERSVRAAGGVVRRLPYRGGTFDVAELESLVTPRTKLLSLCNPHNPLGRVLRRAELESLAAVALRHKLWVLSDEVWSDIVYRPHEHVSLASLDPEIAARTFTVFGFSKSYGLAGLRLGLLVTPDPVQRERVLRLAHADDTAYGVSTLSQIAGAAAYQFAGDWLERFVAHLQRQRDHAVARLNAIPGVHCETPEGTFVVFPSVEGLQLDQDSLADLLLTKYRVAVIPGSGAYFGPGAAGHLRLAFATSRHILSEGLDRVEAGIRSLRDAPGGP